MRCVALFIYNNDDEHLRVRNKIANYLSQHSSEFENIKIPTEECCKSVKEYINYIKLPWKYSGHLEMYATNIIYNINLLSLYDKLDNNHQTLCFKFCYKFSFDNNTQKDLCILTNCYNHYNLLYSKNYNIIKNNNILIFYYNKLSTKTIIYILLTQIIKKIIKINSYKFNEFNVII